MDQSWNKTWIGVDIGGTKTAVVLSSAPPAILERIEFPTLPEQGPDRVIELIKQSIRKLIDSTGEEASSLGAIGVSCGGPLDQATGVIQAPPNLVHMGRCADYVHSSSRNLGWIAGWITMPTRERSPSIDLARDRERAT